MIALPALAVGFAAVCIWLTVRIVNCREKWAKCTLAATLALPVLYVTSFGPACWLTNRGFIDSTISGRLYRPILRLAVQRHKRLSAILRRYALADTSADAYIDTPDGIIDSMLFGK